MLYRQIILEWGQDTESGVWGLGYSPDNGKNFYVLNTTHGRKYRAEDGNRLYPYISDQIQDKIDTVVAPAKSAADSAVAYANDAIEKSRVNSQAIVDINSAVSDAVSDAAVARSDGLRAWNAAQSNVNLIDLNYASASAAISSARTEAIAAADEAKKSASAAQADIVVVRSDVAVQANNLSSYAEQASAAGNDITTLKSQASQLEQDMASTKGDVSQLKVSASSASVALSDAAGNISSLQATATSYSVALSDTNSNVASVTATASELETKYADAAGDINTLKTNASGFSQTLTNAQGDISTLKSTVSGVQTTLTDAQGNISTLQSDVSGLKKTTSDHTGSIATLQATANTLTSQMSSAQGDISTLKQTASDFSSKVSGMETILSDANSKINDIQANGGGRNLLSNSSGRFQPSNSRIDNWQAYTNSAVYMTQGQQYTVHANASSGLVWSGTHNPNVTSNNAVLWLTDNTKISQIISDANTGTGTTFTWNNPSGTYYLRVNTYNPDNSGYVEKVMLEKGIIAHDWSPSPEDVDAKITANTTAIEQNKQAIALKADQTTVDKTNGTVQQLQSQLQVQAGQIATKVSSSDLDAKGYATQTYTQTQIKQASDSWNANLASVKDGLTQSYTNLHATVDGIQAQVYNSDGTSKITQLSNLIATKVSSDDYNSQITQLNNDINLRVKSADLISQINLQAGTALIQSNKLVLDAGTTVFTGKAFIPSAAISSISADKVTIGSSSLYNSDGTLNLVNSKDGTTSKITVTQGNVDFDGTEKNASVIHFASDNNTNAFTITPVGATVTPTLFFERFDQTPGHWLGFTRNETEHEGVMFHTWDDDGERFFVDCHARFDKNLRTLGTLSQGSWDGTTAKPEAGVLTIKNGNTIWSGSDYLAIGSNVTGTYTGVWAKAFVQQSTLSAKTNIETVDPKYALDLVNKTDIRSYQYKSDVAQGYNKRYTSLIIDDVNDVSKYYAPNEFTNEERTGRDDGSAVGYLFLAIQELTRRIKTLEDKLNG